MDIRGATLLILQSDLVFSAYEHLSVLVTILSTYSSNITPNQCSPNVVLGPTASALPGNLLEMQT